MLGTRDSAEERRGWVLHPRTLAWGEAGRSRDGGMRMDTRAKALLSQVLFPPGITLVFRLLTFRAGKCIFHPLTAILYPDRWPWIAPVMVTQARSKCKQGSFSSCDQA